MDGIINIYKEKGCTSHDVVARLRRILMQKKIGHTGTLDPEAEGVLPVCLGNATKLCDLLTDKDKTYQAVLKLGITTDTQDMTGIILDKKEVMVTREEIQRVVFGFMGEYNQIPPMYSALKVNGKKLYELARQGIEIERQPRQLMIHHIEILSIDENLGEIEMTVTCSKGTYIRTLCHDIGEQLGCGGCMKSLIRTKVSQFQIQDSLKLSQVETLQSENQLDAHIVKVDDMFPDYSKIMVKEEYTGLLYNGNILQLIHVTKESEQIDSDFVRVYDSNNRFIAIYTFEQKKEQYRPVRMFL